MNPKEIRCDKNGRNRIERIAYADGLLADASDMAIAAEADPDNGFAAFTCENCATRDPSACGALLYRKKLLAAKQAYARAGLKWFADQVDSLLSAPLSRGCIADAWSQFCQVTAEAAPWE